MKDIHSAVQFCEAAFGATQQVLQSQLNAYQALPSVSQEYDEYVQAFEQALSEKKIVDAQKLSLKLYYLLLTHLQSAQSNGAIMFEPVKQPAQQVTFEVLHSYFSAQSYRIDSLATFFHAHELSNTEKAQVIGFFSQGFFSQDRLLDASGLDHVCEQLARYVPFAKVTLPQSQDVFDKNTMVQIHKKTHQQDIRTQKMQQQSVADVAQDVLHVDRALSVCVAVGNQVLFKARVVCH